MVGRGCFGLIPLMIIINTRYGFGLEVGMIVVGHVWLYWVREEVRLGCVVFPKQN